MTTTVRKPPVSVKNGQMTSEKMKILVVNDDGIFAPGIKHLAKLAAKFGEVVVVAPDSPRSGQSHAVTLIQPLRLHEAGEEDGIRYFSCSGTPADCVKLAIKVVYEGRLPDYVFSGINHGSNASSNAVYSGTVAGMMEAALAGVSAVAFSLTDHSWKADFAPFLPYAEKIMAACVRSGRKDICWNVNCPDVPVLKGIKVCRQARAYWDEDAVERVDPARRKYYWLMGDFVNKDDGKDHDLHYLAEGYVTLTPFHFDWTDYAAMKEWQESGSF